MKGENITNNFDAAATAASRHKGKLITAFGLTSGFMVLEAIGGAWTGSLALLADAAHMLTDAGGLALALIAIRFAERARTPQNTFGYVRLEVLSALTNAVVLLLLTVYILYEAYQRFMSPPEVVAGPMLAIAFVGAIVNLIGMKLLAAGSNESLNVKGAYFEVLADLLGSLGVIIAAIVVLLTGWKPVDPIIGAGIGLFIVPRTWLLLKQAVHVLMEGAPARIDLSLLEQNLLLIPGAVAVKDLHVWSITSGFDAMSCHLVVDETAARDSILAAAQARMATFFGLNHVTIQIEGRAHEAAEVKQRF